MSQLPEFPHDFESEAPNITEYFPQLAALAGTAVPAAMAAAPMAATAHFKVFFILLFLLKQVFLKIIGSPQIFFISFYGQNRGLYDRPKILISVKMYKFPYLRISPKIFVSISMFFSNLKAI